MIKELMKQTKDVLYHFIEENSESLFLESYSQVLVVPKLGSSNTLLTKETTSKEVITLSSSYIGEELYKEFLEIFLYLLFLKNYVRNLKK